MTSFVAFRPSFFQDSKNSRFDPKTRGEHDAICNFMRVLKSQELKNESGSLFSAQSFSNPFKIDMRKRIAIFSFKAYKAPSELNSASGTEQSGTERSGAERRGAFPPQGAL